MTVCYNDQRTKELEPKIKFEVPALCEYLSYIYNDIMAVLPCNIVVFGQHTGVKSLCTYNMDMETQTLKMCFATAYNVYIETQDQIINFKTLIEILL